MSGGDPTHPYRTEGFNQETSQNSRNPDMGSEHYHQEEEMAWR
jgi:hypothetical protein